MEEVNSHEKPSRRDRAKATRVTILRAAKEEFATAGYHGATMASIAARAGVAVQTVHFVFHTKGELLGAVVDHSVEGEDSVPPPLSDWFIAAEAEPDARDALRHFIRGSSTIMAGASALNDVVRAAARSDPDAEANFRRVERLRTESYVKFLNSILAKGELRADVDGAKAVDILLVMLSPRTYLGLVEDRGWTPEQAIDWLADAVPGLIFADTQPGGGTVPRRESGPNRRPHT